MKLSLKRNSQAGFNLIEAAIVLGIVGLIVGGIWTAAASAYGNMRQQNASKQLLAFAQNIKNYYANSSVTTVDTSIANLINAGVVPQDMVSGTSAVSPWQGSVTVGSASSTFTIFYQMPTSMNGSDWQKVCNALVMRNANSAGSGMLDVSVQNTNKGIPVTTPGCTTTTTSVGFIFSIQ